MANQVVEELTITINVDDKGATRKLDAIESRIRRIDSISRSGGFQHLSELAKSLSAISKTGDKLEKVATGLEKVAQSASNTVKNFGNFNTNGITNATNSIRSMTRAMSEMNSQSGREVGGGSLVSGISGVEFLGKQLSAAYSAGKRLASIPFKMMFTPLKGVAKTVNGITSSFGRLGHAIGRVALMRGIRAAIKMITAGIKEGVDHLYLWASAVGNSFKPTMDSLASSFLYLKNSIGAAVSPLLDALAPALETVINKIVDVINIFNQAIATMTGASTWRKAIRSAADYSNNISGLGHEAEGANDSVKELKRTLLGFDEINRLDDKEKTISKGSNGKDATGMYAQEGALSFTEVPVSKAVKDFVGMLKDAWGKADFTEIGSMIGNKIGTALLNVKWDKIQSGVTTLAKSVGTLINGALSYNSEGGKVMWDGIAYTIYNAINTAVLGYVTFFDTVEWDGIGEGIGAALKDVVEHIEWGNVSRALSSFPNAVIDAVNGFNKQFTVEDFKHLGEKIGECVADAIIKIKWADAFRGGLDLVTGIVQAINGCLIKFNDKWATIKDAIVLGIAGVDPQKWSDLGTALGNLVFNAANFLSNVVECLILALEKAEWEKIWEGFKKGLEDCDWDGLRKKIGTFIDEHLSTISIGLALIIGTAALKTGASYLRHLVMNSVVGGSGGLTLAKWAKGLTATAALLLAVAELKNTVDKSGIDSKAFKQQLGSGIAGAVVGLAFFGLTGAALGFTIGVHLNLDVKEMTSNVVAKMVKIKDDLMKDLPGWFKKLMGWDTDTSEFQSISDIWGQATGISAVHEDTKLINPTRSMTTSAQEAFMKYVIMPIGSTLGNFDISGYIYDMLDRTVYAGDAPWNTGGVTNIAPPKTAVSELYTPTGQSYKVNVTGNLVKMEDNLTKRQKTFDNGTITVQEAIDNIQAGDKNTRNWTAIYNHFKGKGVTPTTIVGWIANYTGGMKGLGVIGSVISGFTANYTRGKKGLGVIGEWISDFGAYYTLGKEGDGVTPEWISGFGSVFTSRSIDWASSLWTITGFIAGITSWIANAGKKKADGGVYKNGRWYPVTNFAGGGNPSSGQMFIAREAGPELVGTIGGNTAVLNNDQIVNSVASGVAQAVSSVLGAGSGAPIDITIKVDSETLYRSVKKGERKANGRYGTIVAVG